MSQKVGVVHACAPGRAADDKLEFAGPASINVHTGVHGGGVKAGDGVLLSLFSRGAPPPPPHVPQSTVLYVSSMKGGAAISQLCACVCVFVCKETRGLGLALNSVICL